MAARLGHIIRRKKPREYLLRAAVVVAKLVLVLEGAALQEAVGSKVALKSCEEAK